MKAFDVVIKLENRADRASAALEFVSGCGSCRARKAIHSALLTVAGVMEGNPTLPKLYRQQPDLWEELQAIEAAIQQLEQTVYDVLAERLAPSVN